MDNLKNNLRFLKRMRKLSTKQRKIYVTCCSDQVINCISEVARNLLKGNVRLSARRLRCLKQYKHAIHEVSCKRNNLKKRQKVIIQNVDFLGALLGPAITAISSLIQDHINNN